jgi:hypothetical protein
MLILNFSAFSQKEETLANQKILKVISGNDHDLYLSENSFLIKEDSVIYITDSLQSISFRASNQSIGFNGLTATGYYNSSDSTFNLFIPDNLGFYLSCFGDVWFDSYIKITFNPYSNQWQSNQYISGANCYNSGVNTTICQLMNNIENSITRVKTIHLEQNKVFSLFKNEFIKINDTTINTTIYKPYLDAATIFPDNASIANLLLTNGITLNGNNVLIFSNKTIFRYDTSGTLISYLPDINIVFNQNIQQVFPFSNSEELFVFNKTIYKIDNELNFSDTLNFSNELDSIHSIKLIDNHIWILGNIINTDTIKLLETDTDFNIINSYTITLNDCTPLNFNIENNKLMLYVSEITSPFRNEFSFGIKEYDLQSIQDIFNYDIALENFSFNIYSVYDFILWYYYEKSVSGKLQFTIKNNGTDTINNFRLRASFSGAANSIIDFCDPYRKLVIYINDIELLPNETQTFYYDSINIKTSVSPTSQELCVWLENPNGKIDKDHSNNSSCETLTIVSTKPMNDIENAVQIYPNPANTKVYFSSENVDIETVYISDITGKTLIKSGNINNNSFVNIETLNEGIYFVIIKTTSGEIVTKKLLKQ